MKNIKKLQLRLAKNAYALIAIELVLAIGVAALPLGRSSAVQMSSRNVTLSDSGASGGSISSGIGSGTNVIYKVAFSTTNTSTAVGGIVIDFCGNTALAGDTCTAPTGFNSNKATTAIYNQTGLGSGAFSVLSSDAGTGNGNRIIVTRATAANLTSSNSFELGNGTSNGITNPSTLGSFYARIYTYATAAAATSHNTSAATGYIDYGSVALSTANVITITARVQENISFCVSAASPTANCGGTSVPAVGIGHGSGTIKYIDSTAVDTGTAYTQLSTNAGAGAIIRMHTAYACGGLSTDGGTTCGIPPAGSGASTAGAIANGTAAFGLYVAPSTNSGGSGTVTPDANYYNASHVTIPTDLYYGMDTLTAGNNVTSSYGDSIASCAGPVSNVNNELNFGATASNITPAGLYTTNLALIATGTF